MTGGKQTLTTHSLERSEFLIDCGTREARSREDISWGALRATNERDEGFISMH